MKTAKIKFCFFFGENGTMETTHTGTGETKDDAESNAWLAMAQDNFKRELILKTTKIVCLSTEFI